MPTSLRAGTSLATLALSVAMLLTSAAHAEESGTELGRERAFLEAGVGLSQSVADPYTERIEQFSFRRAGQAGSAMPTLVGVAVLGLMLTPHLGVLGRYEGLERRTYSRDFSDSSIWGGDDFFAWTTRAVSLGLRARLPVRSEWFAVYGETSAGFAWAQTRAWGETLRDKERFRSYALGARIGLLMHPARYFGFFTEGGYTYAPVIENLLGEVHNDGGISIVLGLRLRTLGGY